ncbi:MAG: tetratricopeptide repeat protein [Chitinivibrionales bacterium]|nr:tetratricopeptide repeat protein [Chitinivibrionales bacterium]
MRILSHCSMSLRWSGALFAAFLFVACGRIDAYEPFEESEVKKNVNKESIITLRVFDSQKKVVAQGNAFFVSDSGDAITNRHLLDKAYSIEAVSGDGTVYSDTKIRAEDKTGDLLWISVSIPAEKIHPLQIEKKKPSAGEQIMVMVSATLVSDGTVSSILTIPDYGDIIKITAPISQGATGSPVVNMSGTVLGVATFRNIDGQNHVYAIPAGRIKAMKPDSARNIHQWQSSRSETKKAVAEELYADALPFIMTGMYEEALDILIEAVTKNPGYITAYTQLAHCYNRLGALEEAGEALAAILRISPRDTRAYYNLARNYSERGMYNDAMLTLKEALKVNPEFPAALTLMGWIYNETGAPHDAIKSCKKAINIKADFEYAHVVLGTAYMKVDKLDWAVNSFKMAHSINPDNPDILYNLGLAYLKNGDKDSAMAQYAALAKIDTARAEKLRNQIE